MTFPYFPEVKLVFGSFALLYPLADVPLGGFNGRITELSGDFPANHGANVKFPEGSAMYGG